MISHFTASMTKKLSKRTASKQTAEQSVKNDQSSVQTSTSSKTSKKLTQFFAGEFSKTSSGSFKIKLEALTFKSEPGLLSKESDQSDNHDNDAVSHVSQKADSESKFKDEISNEEVLKILKKQIKK